jgi:hypothetical protein
MTKRLPAALLAIVIAGCMNVFLAAQQSPHGGPNVKPQPGPNTSAAGGIVANLATDPAAIVKTDVLQQRQNETVVAASVRNPDHILAAANDYRFVDFPDDVGFGGQSFFARLMAKLFGRPSRQMPPKAAAVKGAWTGVYRSCDRGRTWIGGALPGGPIDNSSASVFPDGSPKSPLKFLSRDAALANAHGETTDPVLVAGPNGRMHLFVLGYFRFPNGSVGESRMFYTSYTDLNNREGGACFTFDFSREIDRSTLHFGPNAPTPFLDKPSAAVDKDGTLYVAYTVFLDQVKSKIVVARSTNGGVSWSKTTPLLNLGVLRNHGTTMAVDQLNGTVNLAWRVFYQDWPLMVISKSYDRGRTFLPATPISHFWPTKNLDQIIQQLKAAKLRPFDQFSSQPGDPATARSLAFPHIVAGVVNGKSKLFAVWQERADGNGQPSFTGSPRIMLSMSTDGGWSWTPRRAVDAGQRTENEFQIGVGDVITRNSGPQVQPVLSINGLTNPQLLLMYYEAREELDVPFENNFISGIEREMDVRVARINPVTGLLVAPSVQVSQYPILANSSPVALAETAPGYRMANRTNLTIYGGGNNGFFGDYPHLAPSVTMEHGSGWKWATEPSPVLAIWTDNRDVKFPRNAIGDPDINVDQPWPYTPVTPGGPPVNCSNVGTRNASPFFDEVGGVVAGALQTFKPFTVQRAFAPYVENRTPDDRFFRLTIHDNEAGGLDGSFVQRFPNTPPNMGNVDVVDVEILANSSHTRTLWVEPFLSNPTASLRVTVEEISAIGAASPKANGFRTRLILNPDPNNDALTNIPTPVDPGLNIANSEVHNATLSAPQFSAFRIGNPQFSAPQLSAPQLSAPQFSAPGATPQVSAPQFSAPQFSAPQFSAPAESGEANGTDVTFTVTNDGNTTSTYNALFDVPNAQQLLESGNYQFQVLVTRTSLVPGILETGAGCQPAATTHVQVIANIPVPQFSAPQFSAISNPQFSAPQFSAPALATFAVAPSGGASGQNSHGPDDNEDPHSNVFRDEVKISLRAVRRTLLSAGGPLFNPATVRLRIDSHSTNVLNGVVQPDGTQPTTTSAGPATQLAFIVQPSDEIAGEPISPAIQVAVRDANGALVTTSTAAVTLQFEDDGGNPGEGTLFGSLTQNAVNGVATFSSIAINNPAEGYELVATSPGLLSDASESFDILEQDAIVQPNTDYVSAGRGGMRGYGLGAPLPAGGDGTGTIVLSGVSGQVTMALLYWHGPTNSADASANATVLFNGTTVVGTNIGLSQDNNWDFDNSHAYRANVTSLVTGNGTYTLANFRKAGAGPPIADINGVSLLVFFNDGNTANNVDVYLFDGNDSNVPSDFDGAGWDRTLGGINVPVGRIVRLELHVADGQDFTPATNDDDGEILLNGTQFRPPADWFSGTLVPGPNVAGNGNLWDIRSFIPVGSPFVTFGTTNTLQLTSPAVNDALGLVVAVVVVGPNNF